MAEEKEAIKYILQNAWTKKNQWRKFQDIFELKKKKNYILYRVPKGKNTNFETIVRKMYQM